MTIKNDVESSVAYAAEKTHNAIDETEEKIDESIDATDARFASIETLLRDARRLEELTRGDHTLRVSAAHDGLEIEL